LVVEGERVVVVKRAKVIKAKKLERAAVYVLGLKGGKLHCTVVYQ
jgi:hypothetical protein